MVLLRLLFLMHYLFTSLQGKLAYVCIKLTEVSCCDGLESNRLHCPSSQNKLMSTIVKTLQRNKEERAMNLTVWFDDPLPIVQWLPITLSMSIIFINTSVTNIGRSSAHWQYSTTILISRSTIL